MQPLGLGVKATQIMCPTKLEERRKNHLLRSWAEMKILKRYGRRLWPLVFGRYSYEHSCDKENIRLGNFERLIDMFNSTDDSPLTKKNIKKHGQPVKGHLRPKDGYMCYWNHQIAMMKRHVTT